MCVRICVGGGEGEMPLPRQLAPPHLQKTFIQKVSFFFLNKLGAYFIFYLIGYEEKKYMGGTNTLLQKLTI